MPGAPPHRLTLLSNVMRQTLPQPRQALVALHAGRGVTWAQLRNDVAASAAKISALPASAEPKAALHTTDAYPFAVGLMALWQLGKTVCLPGHAGAVTMPLSVSEASLSVGETSSSVLPPARASTGPALIVFTSGSTGEPKEVPKSFSQLDAEVATLERTFGAAFDDALVLGTVSQQHFYGFLFRVAWPLAAGRTFTSEASLFPQAWFEATLQHERVAWVSSPAFYRRLWAELPWAKAAPRVVAACSSGGALGEDTSANIASWLGQPIVEIFGSSETGGVATRRGRGGWRAFDAVEVERREDGALLVRSPHLPSTQWQAMDDAVELRDDGTFGLLGRLDHVVKVEDKRVSLADLECALIASPLVREARSALLETGGRQEVGAVVALSAEGIDFMNSHGRLELAASLKKTLPAHLPAVAGIRRFRFVSALPVDGLGKVTAAAIVEMLRSKRQVLPGVLEVKPNGAGKVTLVLDIEPDLAALEGHFPEAPVVAGVAQIDWAIRLSRSYLPVPSRGFSKLEAVKFQQVMQPGQHVELSLDWNLEKRRLAFSYVSSKGPCSSGRVVLSLP